LPVAAQRLRISTALVLGIGFAIAIAGVTIVFSGGLGFQGGMLEMALKPLVTALLLFIGPAMVMAVAAALIVGCVMNFFIWKEDRIGLAVRTLFSLLFWAAAAYGMFIVMFITFVYAKGTQPNEGFVVPALLISIGHILLGCGLVLWTLRKPLVVAAE
jgi:hypothetical protein